MGQIRRIILTVLAIIGFITSIKLTTIFYEANYNPYALNSFCTVNNFIDCDGVAKTPHAQVFGIPLAIWGLILYLFFLFLTYVDKLSNIKFLGFLKVFKNPTSYIFAVGLMAFFMSMTLAAISLFEIKKLCILCFFTYILNLFIALVAMLRNKRIDDLLKDCFSDFFEALQVPRYSIAFAIVVLVGISTLFYTSKTYVLAPHMQKLQEIHKLSKLKGNPYKVSGNVLGDKDAKIVLYVYTDYQCPSCAMYNIILHKAVKKLKGIRIVHRNFPLDSECNKDMQFQLHPGSCLLSKYNIAAGYQNKYWDMNNMLFEKKPANEDLVLQYAQELGLDTDKLKKDAYSDKVTKELEKELKFAYDNNLKATPTLQIGVKFIPGLVYYSDLEKMLLEAGAKRR